MAGIKPVGPYDLALKTECPAFNFKEGYVLEDGTRIFAEEIFETLKRSMCDNRGVGLAAPQLGMLTRVFVIGNPDDPDSVIPVFNPRIVNYSDDVMEYEEGCISFPGLFLKIKRPRTIRARYTTHEGVTDTINFDGFTARVFQHEYDHLDGIVFKQHVSRIELDRAYMVQKKLNRQKKQNDRNKRNSPSNNV